MPSPPLLFPPLPLLTLPARREYLPAPIAQWRNGTAAEVGARDERGLLRSGWLAVVSVLALLAVAPAMMFGVEAASIAAVVAVVLMAVWSDVASRNVLRARPGTVYSRPPRPMFAALSWLGPLGVVALGVAAMNALQASSFARDLPADERLVRIRVVVGLVAAVPLLVAWWIPHAAMARSVSWVGGTRRHWQRRCGAPILAMAAGVLVVVSVELTAELQGSASSPLADDARAIVAALGLVVVPLLVTAWASWTAMRQTERASRITWERRNFLEGSLDLTDHYVARAATAAYLASHPDG